MSLFVKDDDGSTVKDDDGNIVIADEIEIVVIPASSSSIYRVSAQRGHVAAVVSYRSKVVGSVALVARPSVLPSVQLHSATD